MRFTTLNATETQKSSSPIYRSNSPDSFTKNKLMNASVLILINFQASSLVYFEPKVDRFKLENFAPFVNDKNIAEICAELSDAIYHIERNGNAKIIFTDLSIKLTRLIHKK